MPTKSTGGWSSVRPGAVAGLASGQGHDAAADGQDAVLAVVADDEGDGDLLPGGGPEALDAVKGRTIAQETDNRPVGPGELDAERTAQAPAKCPAAVGEVAGRVAKDAQLLEHVAVRGDGLLDDGRAWWQDAGQGAHEGRRVMGCLVELAFDLGRVGPAARPACAAWASIRAGG